MRWNLSQRVISAKVEKFCQYAVLEWTKAFADVEENLWTSDVIKVMASKRIIEGVNETKFNIQANVNRAEFAVMIVRMLGQDLSSRQSLFADVDANAWYCGVVEAANQAGIVSGWDSETFAPDTSFTHAEMVVMIVRAYGYMNGKKVETATPSTPAIKMEYKIGFKKQ